MQAKCGLKTKQYNVVSILVRNEAIVSGQCLQSIVV